MDYIKLTNEEFEILRELRSIYPCVYDFLIENHINIIRKIYHQKYKFYWFFEEDDIIQEGCIAMLEAIDRYEPEKVNKGSYRSYLTQCVKLYLIIYKDMQYILCNHGGVKMPRSLSQQVSKFRLWGRDKYSDDIEQLCKDYCKEKEVNFDYFYKAIKLSYSSFTSVNTSLDDDNIFNKLVHIDKHIFLENNYDLLYDAVDNLKMKHASRVIQCRYFENMTLKQAGELIGISSERVRVIEKESLSKLYNMLIRKRELIW